jgi:branched-subunit amino acid ABC-type transport system permease component
MDIFVQQLINGLVLGSIYALVALGYTMVYGILELINFAHHHRYLGQFGFLGSTPTAFTCDELVFAWAYFAH